MYTKIMQKHPPQHRKTVRTRSIVIGVLLVALIIVGIGSFMWLRADKLESPASKPQKTAKQPTSQLPKIDLQPTVDTWVARQSADYGIVVYDPAYKTVIASHQPDKQFFTASIYKLYVAYVALLDIQNGTQDPNQVVLPGHVLRQCIYKMIHSSDSPCGEKVLNNMGQAALTERLNTDFALTNTAFPAFVTSAQDAATILIRLQAKQDLNVENTDFLLDAMKTQIYRTGLPKGMPQATVANKVGFNDPKEWHDTGIITLPNGREYIVSILGGNGAKSAHIADFAQTIYSQLAE